MNLSKENLLSALLYLTIFIAGMYLSSDPDLGWHLRYGEHFFKTGSILRENIHSQLMDGYRWVNSSWATDLLSYSAFRFLGFLGLSLLGALTITLTFYFLGKAAKLNLFQKSIIFPPLFSLVVLVNSFSFRGQQLTYLFIAIMLYVLSRYSRQNPKTLWILLPLFILWSNFHGGFTLGLLLLAIWFLTFFTTELFSARKGNIKNLIKSHNKTIQILCLTFLATLINPFGIDIFVESFTHMSSPYTRFISEWVPFGKFTHLWWWEVLNVLIIILSIVIFLFRKKLIQFLPFLSVSVLLYFLSLAAKRNVWPFYYSSVFFIKPIVEIFEKRVGKRKLLISGILIFAFFLIVLAIRKPYSKFYQMNWNTYCVLMNCSPKGAEYIIENKLNKKKVLTIYDWGGWLIWNYPEIKPTIDGRMALWKDENGFSAFSYYFQYETGARSIEDSDYEVVFASRFKPVFYKMVDLVEEKKWEPVYVDGVSAVFVRR